MTAPERPDDAALARGLGMVNAARRRADDDPERAVGLLGGLERILEAIDPGDGTRSAEGGQALRELDALMEEAGGEGLERLRDFLVPILERLIEGVLDRPERRLAAYGSLRPGEENHHEVSDLVGRWSEGTVRGTLHERGWGATHGYPALVWDPEGDEIPVGILESGALPGAWERLDRFEGPGYRRVLVPVESGGTQRVCNLYELAGGPDPPGRG